jgi:Ca2+-binding EF-hand superfamily protein
MRRIFLITLLMTVAAGPVLAADPMPSPDSIYALTLFPGSLDQYLGRLQLQFKTRDVNRDGRVAPDDIRAVTEAFAAAWRASRFGQLMHDDLDGDGVITLDEVREFYLRRNTDTLPQRMRDEFQSQMQSDLTADADHDGRITFNEGYAFAEREAEKQPEVKIGLSMEMFNPAVKTGDAVTWDAVRAYGTTYFGILDTDHDGQLSMGEVAVARPSLRPVSRDASRDAQMKGCEMPKASAGAQIILLSAEEGQGVSSVALGSQDVGVDTAVVHVAAGDTPLYVVITSFHPVIWRFTGATARIEHAVLDSTKHDHSGIPTDGPGPVGATGLPASRVSFPARKGCLPSAVAAAAITVNWALGRSPGITKSHDAVSSFELPSGAIQETPDHYIHDSLESEVRLYHPDGVVTIDPATVVASRPVQRYTVLPDQAGLQQLVRQGALTQNSKGQFLIHRKIRFPSELYGAHAVQFLLLKGVPAPDGDPGHSCVMSEETGQPLANAFLCH